MPRVETGPGKSLWLGVWSFLQLQLGWLACVMGAVAGLYWLGPAVVAVLLLVYLNLAGAHWRRDLWLFVVFGVLGSGLDSLLSALGILTFKGSLAPWLCPLWITALWMHFATSRDSLFAVLAGRPWLAVLTGLVGGPLAYGAGVRLGVVAFHPEPWRSQLVLAAVWTLVIPLAARLAGPGKRSLAEPLAPRQGTEAVVGEVTV